VETEAIEEALYADLPTAHILRKADLPSPDGLLSTYELAQHQAVLLRAVRLRARIFCASAAGYRALFRKLKFHRLLYTMEKLARGAGYAIDIDGPFSLFEQTTKYGLKLALALPALMTCDTWDVDAELRWGKDRRPLRYHMRGSATPTVAAAAELPEEVAALLGDLQAQESPWQATPPTPSWTCRASVCACPTWNSSIAKPASASTLKCSVSGAGPRSGNASRWPPPACPTPSSSRSANTCASARKSSPTTRPPPSTSTPAP
jgi:hypothetical protein